MFSPFLSGVLLSVAAIACQGRTLRVCADPDNLPFSNESGAGFENKLAELVSRDLHAQLVYTWWAERKSFLKNSLLAGRCDVVMGLPTDMDSALTTAPYYRSTYVFVSRRDRGLGITSLTDPRLEQWKIGVHIVGDDYAPPAQALGRLGLSANIVGYSLFGAWHEPNPPAKIVRAVTNKDVDVAIVWGPLAGYFAQQLHQELVVTPVSPPMWMGIPFTYKISMGVRPGDAALKAELDRVLIDECPAIHNLLSKYGVPETPEDKSRCAGSEPLVSASSH